MTEEEELIERIRDIHESAQHAAKPYIDRLVYLRCLKPMPPMILTQAMLDDSILERIKPND